MQCRITGDNNAPNYFFINSQTCIITLSASVQNTGVTFYRVSILSMSYKIIYAVSNMFNNFATPFLRGLFWCLHVKKLYIFINLCVDPCWGFRPGNSTEKYIYLCGSYCYPSPGSAGIFSAIIHQNHQWKFRNQPACHHDYCATRGKNHDIHHVKNNDCFSMFKDVLVFFQ